MFHYKDLTAFALTAECPWNFQCHCRDQRTNAGCWKWTTFCFIWKACWIKFFSNCIFSTEILMNFSPGIICRKTPLYRKQRRLSRFYDMEFYCLGTKKVLCIILRFFNRTFNERVLSLLRKNIKECWIRILYLDWIRFSY